MKNIDIKELIEHIENVLKSHTSHLSEEDTKLLESALVKYYSKPRLTIADKKFITTQVIKVCIEVGIEVLIHRFNE